MSDEPDLDFQDDIEFEREIKAPKYERTPPEFPTPGPGDGRTWHEFFREIRAAREAGELIVPRMEITVTDPMRPIVEGELSTAPSNIRTYAKLIVGNGFTTRVYLAKSHRSQGYYLSKDHEKYGEPRDDQTPEDRILWMVSGTKPGVGWAYVSVLQRPNINEVSCRFWNNLDTLLGDRELKQRIKGEYDEQTTGDRSG